MCSRTARPHQSGVPTKAKAAIVPITSGCQLLVRTSTRARDTVVPAAATPTMARDCLAVPYSATAYTRSEKTSQIGRVGPSAKSMPRGTVASQIASTGRSRRNTAAPQIAASSASLIGTGTPAEIGASEYRAVE